MSASSIWFEGRAQPAIDLVNRIGLSRPEKILDVGCGPGNSSRVLKNRYRQARVTGIDNSENMLEKARADHPDIEFMLCDVSGDLRELDGGYDIVFSNACLQWVPDHGTLIGKLMNLLIKDGVLAVQVPYNFSEPVHTILDDLSSSARWREYFTEKRNYHKLSPGEYFDILADITPDFEIWETVYYHVMKSTKTLWNGIAAPGFALTWMCCLVKKSEFEQDVLGRLIEAYPKQKNGDHFPVPEAFLHGHSPIKTQGPGWSI